MSAQDRVRQVTEAICGKDIPVGHVMHWCDRDGTLSRRIYAGNDVWLTCDGSAYDYDLYPELYELIGNMYGGKLPDLRVTTVDNHKSAGIG